MNQTISATIKGTSALLMHAFPMVPVKNPEKLSIEEQAELAAYRDPEGQLFVPGVALQRCLVNGAGYSKGKGRASLQKVAAACLEVSPERILLGKDKWDEIDTRPVVVPATKGRVLRHRPRFNQWELSFTLQYDPTLLTEDQVRTIVDDSGTRVGLLDFRPMNRGPYGRFMVISWRRG